MFLPLYFKTSWWPIEKNYLSKDCLMMSCNSSSSTSNACPVLFISKKLSSMSRLISLYSASAGGVYEHKAKIQLKIHSFKMYLNIFRFTYKSNQWWQFSRTVSEASWTLLGYLDTACLHRERRHSCRLWHRLVSFHYLHLGNICMSLAMQIAFLKMLAAHPQRLLVSFHLWKGYQLICLQ